MTKTTTIIAMNWNPDLANAVTARPQTTFDTTADPSIFRERQRMWTIQSRTFLRKPARSLCSDTRNRHRQPDVGSGFVFDASAGYRVWRRLSAAVAYPPSRIGYGESIVAIPNPLFFGHEFKSLSAS